MSKRELNPEIVTLYDDYCHGYIDRREFFRRAAKLGVGAAAGIGLASSMLPRYAEAQTISFTDDRMRARYVTYASPGGNSGAMRGYLVTPTAEGPHRPVLVIHENRGLNPHIEDVARRAAVAGFVALAPDGLAPVGGYPGNDDDGRTLQRGLDRQKLLTDMKNSALYLAELDAATGPLGVTGFCWGGYATNWLASELGDRIAAAVPFYGSGVDAAAVSGIRAKLLVQAAENDGRINAAWPDFEAALKANGVDYQRHLYPGTNHGFHNNSTPRYDEAAAKLAWERTLAFFDQHLG
ncbi:MAG: dienelactone hydrolase family protein [Pseudomonadota bacterium]